MKIAVLNHLILESGIGFKLIETDAKSVTYLIHKDDLKKIEKLLVSINFKKAEHRFSKKNGYNYQYQLHEFLLYIGRGLEVVLLLALPCASLTPKTFIPLDKEIQNEAWVNEEKNIESEKLPKIVKFLYCVTQSIFLCRSFNDANLAYIQNNIDLLENEKLKNMLQKVFFKFTDRLIELLKNHQFTSIVKEYISFSQY